MSAGRSIGMHAYLAAKDLAEHEKLPAQLAAKMPAPLARPALHSKGVCADRGSLPPPGSTFPLNGSSSFPAVDRFPFGRHQPFIGGANDRRYERQAAFLSHSRRGRYAIDSPGHAEDPVDAFRKQDHSLGAGNLW